MEPTSHLGVPRVWEKIMEGIQEVVAQSGFIRRKMLLWAMSVTLQHNLTSPGRCGGWGAEGRGGQQGWVITPVCNQGSDWPGLAWPHWLVVWGTCAGPCQCRA